MTWAVERVTGPAGAFHEREPSYPFPRAVWVADPTAPALVLGSTQQPDVVAPGATIDVVRRRSGGGAVLVEPGAQVWIDVLLPADDDLWDDDVGRSFRWLGEVWQRALADLGLPATPHDGAMCTNRWSRLVCFAGLGPGELVDEHGRKVVGISQRRTRDGARFQCSAPLVPWDPAPILDLLALSDGDRVAAVADLTNVVAHVPVAHDTVLEAFLHHLP